MDKFLSFYRFNTLWDLPGLVHPHPVEVWCGMDTWASWIILLFRHFLAQLPKVRPQRGRYRDP